MTHPYNTLTYGQTLAGTGQVVMSETLGVPLHLRTIPGCVELDAAGLYPLSPKLRTVTRDAVRAELRALGAISLVLVSDPASTPVPPDCFDLVRPYKDHHVIEGRRTQPPYSKHHRAELRRAERRCEAREIELADHLQDFTRLYEVLIARHALGETHRFEAAHFAHLAAHPEDFPAFGAFAEGRLVSAHIWARHGRFAHSHLAASDAEGYEAGAAYAVNDVAIRTFAGSTLINLGGVADGSAGDGLARFKAGFANATRRAYLCGLVADQEAYNRLSAPLAALGPSEYFPRYRQPRSTH